MERTISATPRHSEDELKQLFTKTLKLSSLWYAYEMLKDDSDFYGLLKNEIGIGKDNFNRWLRERIGLYSMEDIPPLQ